ncbi:unnamed protein product, partial [Ectocarpus fasciculatus]
AAEEEVDVRLTVNVEEQQCANSIKSFRQASSPIGESYVCGATAGIQNAGYSAYAYARRPDCEKLYAYACLLEKGDSTNPSPKNSFLRSCVVSLSRGCELRVGRKIYCGVGCE